MSVKDGDGKRAVEILKRVELFGLEDALAYATGKKIL